jgi:hypothetical protein
VDKIKCVCPGFEGRDAGREAAAKRLVQLDEDLKRLKGDKDLPKFINRVNAAYNLAADLPLNMRKSADRRLLTLFDDYAWGSKLSRERSPKRLEQLEKGLKWFNENQQAWEIFDKRVKAATAFSENLPNRRLADSAKRRLSDSYYRYIEGTWESDAARREAATQFEQLEANIKWLKRRIN